MSVNSDWLFIFLPHEFGRRPLQIKLRSRQGAARLFVAARDSSVGERVDLPWYTGVPVGVIGLKDRHPFLDRLNNVLPSPPKRGELFVPGGWEW